MIVDTLAWEGKNPRISKLSVLQLPALTKFIVYDPFLTNRLGSVEILILRTRFLKTALKIFVFTISQFVGCNLLNARSA